MPNYKSRKKTLVLATRKIRRSERASLRAGEIADDAEVGDERAQGEVVATATVEETGELPPVENYTGQVQPLTAFQNLTLHAIG